jgi:hypothetical protein
VFSEADKKPVNKAFSRKGSVFEYPPWRQILARELSRNPNDTKYKVLTTRPMARECEMPTTI